MNRYTHQHFVIKNKEPIKQKQIHLHLFCTLLFSFLLLSAAAQLVRSASGPVAAAILPGVEAFRMDLGPLNANVPGSFTTGRREINWDGVPNSFSAPNNFPANFFNVNSPRGTIFSTPGTGFQTSANAGFGDINFGNIDPTYPSLFEFFSPQRLFTALNSNITDVHFFVPGTNIPALTKGFGAVFIDVDLPNTTSIEYFGPTNNSLGIFYAPSIFGSETYSFLGVSFPTPMISRVRITSGNAALGAGVLETLPTIDLVVMDDFIYGEPVAIAPPCPTITVTIPDAMALPSGVQPNTVYPGVAPSITLTANISGGTGPYDITWSTGSHDPSITVSPATATTYTVNVTDANGCPSNTASITVNVVDVRDGRRGNKVVICHIMPNKFNLTLSIGADDIADHMAHGDMLGSCSPSPAIVNRSTSTDDEDQITAKITLSATPNPFVNTTRIQYRVPVDAMVSIMLYDLTGREVGIIYNGNKATGMYSFEYNSTKLKAGVYYCLLIATANGKQYRQLHKLIKAN